MFGACLVHGHQLRLHYRDANLFMQEWACGNWSSEVPVFREAFTAMECYFKRRLPISKRRPSGQALLEREVQPQAASKVSKLQPELDDALPAIGETEESTIGGDTDIDECTICMDALADVMFFPCRHSGVCKQCAEHIRSEQRTCPFCRSPIQHLADANCANVALASTRPGMQDKDQVARPLPPWLLELMEEGTTHSAPEAVDPLQDLIRDLAQEGFAVDSNSD
jgi:hypothetical protein